MPPAVEINVLGPVELRVDGEPVALPRRQTGLVLGLLALAHPEPLSRDRLIDLLWGQDPPRRAAAVLQTRISELRASLRGGVESRGGGYRLAVEASIDARRFEALLTSSVSVAGLRSALTLWRGEVLGGRLEGSVPRRLDSLRVAALEDLFALEVHHGNTAPVLDDLLEFSAAHPSRERALGLLMAALHANGRAAEALHHYENHRRTLREELGVDPGPGLRALHLAVLDPDSSLRAHTRALLPASTAPSTLPPDIPDFAGRSFELRLVTDALRAGRTVTVSGPGGIGKSALCTRAAYEVAGAFPDGQLYLDLHGYDHEGRVEPWTALGRILRLLGVEESAVPRDHDERVDLYRRLTAQRQVLVVLDNVASDEQVLPLLPGGTRSRALVNGRNRLGASFGALPVALDVLDEGSARELIAGIVGAARLEPEPDAVKRLVAECGGLPLALRIVAARLAGRPHWAVDRIAGQLADERSKLDQLSYAHLDVRATIWLSYRGLADSTRALLRRICHLGPPDVTTELAGAVLDTGPAAAERELELLFDAQLLEAAGASHYRLHDLVRLFGRERALETPADLDACRDRVLGHYLSAVDVVYRATSGGGDAVRSSVPRRPRTAPPATGWFDAERANVAALVGVAALHGDTEACWDLACTSSQLYAARQLFDDTALLTATALAEVERAGDLLGQAAVRHRLGIHHTDSRAYDDAFRELRRAETLFEQVGDEHGQGLAAAYLGVVTRFTDRPDDALTHYKAAVTAFRNTGDVYGEAFALRGTGQAEMARGRFSAAAENFEQALALYRSQAAVHPSVAQVLFFQGMLNVQQARTDRAEELFDEVLVITRAVSDPAGQAQAMRGHAFCHHARGNREAARASLEAARQLVRNDAPTYMLALIESTMDDLDLRGAAL